MTDYVPNTVLKAAQLNTSFDEKLSISNALSELVGAESTARGNLGLGNVDNTSDANKPLSTAAQTALNLKADASSLAIVATSGSYTNLVNKPTLGTAAAENSTVFATAAQGTRADSAIQSAVAGTNITIDVTDPHNPIISATGSAVGGDVVGPAVATDGHVAVFDGSTGKILKDGGALATVATSGAYSDLSGKPTIPSGTVTSVAMSVPTGLSVSGSPVTASGTFAVTWAAGYQGYTSAEATKLAGIATGATANTGTVTSVAATVPTGISVSGSPITASGTLAFTWTAGYQSYTTAEATKLSGIATGAQVNLTPATAAQLQAGTANVGVNPDVVMSAIAFAALTAGTTVSIDHAAGMNRSLAPAQNFTFAAPTNPKPGLALNIAIKQPASGGPYTASYNAAFNFGAAGAPTLSTAAGAEDLLCFVCRASGDYEFLGIGKGF